MQLSFPPPFPQEVHMKYAISFYDFEGGDHQLEIIVARSVQAAVLQHSMSPWTEEPHPDDFDTEEEYEDAHDEWFECPSTLEAILDDAQEYNLSIRIKDIT
jgi:hypothetical protein